MKFARISILLSLLGTGSFVAYAQSDFAVEEGEDGNPDVDGMFDEEGDLDLELEALDEEDEAIRGSRRSRDRSPRPIRRPTEADLNTQDRFRSGGRASNNSRGGGSSNVLSRYKGEIPNPNEKLRMDFIQVDIEEVVKYFAERLRKKFIYDPSILKGKITIISPTEVTVDEAWAALLSAMEIRGYVIYPAGPYLKIEKVANARKSPVPVYNKYRPPDDDTYITRILTLRYLGVGDIRNAVRDLLSRSGGDVIEHAPTNTLIISDYASNIRRIVRILNILDVEGFSEQIAVIELKHASATDIANKVTEFFPQQATTSRSRRSRRRRSRRSRQAAASQNNEVIQKVVADERTNSVIILGSERGIEQVKQFIQQIDVPIEGGGGQIHVYPLQNVKAEEISQTLASLTTGKRPGTTSDSRSSTRSRRSRSTRTTRTSNTPSVADLLGGEVKITADTATNSLVIQASPRDYEVLKQIIQKLDIRRRQVFIESIILEANTGRGLSFGANASGPLLKTRKLADPGDETNKSAFFGNVGDFSTSLDNLLADPSGLTGLALGFRSGSTYTIERSNQDGSTSEIQLPLLSAIIRLAANSSKVNVLSTPHILATANEEASIEIGEEVPTIAGSTNTNAGVTNNVERLKVATALTITPQINAGDYLTLAIDQQIDEIKPGGGSNLGPTTTNRKAKTTVIVKDGQTIVIGGLMTDRKLEQVNKVPLLGDIPILGWLFKSKTTDVSKVNLLLFITPHIIRDTADSNDIFFRKLKERQGFLQDLGMDEKNGIPFAGYSEEQLKFLDEEYLKSLKLVPYREPRLPIKEGTRPDIPEPASFEGLSPPLEQDAPADEGISPGAAPDIVEPDFVEEDFLDDEGEEEVNDELDNREVEPAPEPSPAPVPSLSDEMLVPPEDVPNPINENLSIEENEAEEEEEGIIENRLIIPPSSPSETNGPSSPTPSTAPLGPNNDSSPAERPSFSPENEPSTPGLILEDSPPDELEILTPNPTDSP